MPFAVRLVAEPRSAEPSTHEPPGGGLLDMAADVWGAARQGTWTLSLGGLDLQFPLPEALEHLEGFWVLLLELVDSDSGEWSLFDGRQETVLEARVSGPDVHIEFVADRGRPRFGGVDLPARATVRLRALVEQGTAFVLGLVDEACAIDPTLRDSADLPGLLADAAALRGAVAQLPATFAVRGAGGAA